MMLARLARLARPAGGQLKIARIARIVRIVRIAGSAAAAMTERLSGTVTSHMPSVHGQVNTVRAQPIHRD